jgi:peptide-methionine (S)-S-oxide reductase
MIRYLNIVYLSIAVLFAGLSSESAAAEKKLSLMIVAGGCFWCVESDFDHVNGVVETISGYTGGHLKNPTYRDVTSGGSGHLEVVAIKYDPAKTDYATLLDVFWRSVDPTDGGGQFCDRGESYSTAIYTTSPEQKKLAEASKAAIEKSGVLKRPIATKIADAGAFYPAEDYHQNYYRTNPLRYKFYRFNCGRDQRIIDLWGDDAHQGIKKH